MNNDQCNGSGPHVGKQVRVLPLGSESNHGNAILCLGCFNREMQFRKDRNRAASRNCLSLIPKWEELEVYGEEPPSQVKPKKARCPHTVGVWINKRAGNFRCLKCGCQYHLRDLPKVKRNIQHWED